MYLIINNYCVFSEYSIWMCLLILKGVGVTCTAKFYTHLYMSIQMPQLLAEKMKQIYIHIFGFLIFINFVHVYNEICSYLIPPTPPITATIYITLNFKSLIYFYN